MTVLPAQQFVSVDARRHCEDGLLAFMNTEHENNPTIKITTNKTFLELFNYGASLRGYRPAPPPHEEEGVQRGAARSVELSEDIGACLTGKHTDYRPRMQLAHLESSLLHRCAERRHATPRTLSRAPCI